MVTTKVYECRYVNRDDPGDLVWGYNWRTAILVDEGGLILIMPNEEQIKKIEENMFDKETGACVGDTRNFCVNPHCQHEDCAPTTLLVEF